MIDDIKIFRGVLSKTDFSPEHLHFQIRNQTIEGSNKIFTIHTPIACDLNCQPKGKELLKAIEKSREGTQLTLTGKGKLSIKTGNFRALIECYPDSLPIRQPQGEFFQIDGEQFLQILNQLNSIIQDDNTHPWATGMLLANGACYVTDNIILIEKALNCNITRPVIIPKATLLELHRIGWIPQYIQVCEHSITFYFSQYHWLISQIIGANWPDISQLFYPQETALAAVPEGLFDALKDLEPFADELGRVYFLQHKIATSRDENNAAAVIEIPGIQPGGIYQIKRLLKLVTICDKIDFSYWPKKTPFSGDQLRGVIVGLTE